MLAVGCHLSSAKGYAAMGRTALKIGATTFAFFTRNPRGGAARKLDAADVERLRAMLAEEGFAPLVAHAPYTYNLCSAKEQARTFALEAMREDLERLEVLPGNYYNFHPGSHVGQGVEAGIDLIARALAEVLQPDQSTRVLLETMAGKGTEVGGRFEEIAAIIAAVEEMRPELTGALGVCLDTCHVADAGYDIVHDLDGVLAEFDRVIGLERLRAIHLNDSKNPCGARKDRHARLGEGYLGAPDLGGGPQVFSAIVRHPRLAGLPFVLETPNELDGYAREIAWLRALAAGEDVAVSPHEEMSAD